MIKKNHLKDVTALIDVSIQYTGDVVPSYRVYVADELFVERRYLYQCSHLEENIPVRGPYGLYPIRVELLPHENAVLRVKNHRVIFGPGRFRKHGLEIHDEAS